MSENAVPDSKPRYRAGGESVEVTSHDTPGEETYGPESGEIETVDGSDGPIEEAADPNNPKQRTGHRQAAANRENDPPA